MSTLLSFFAGVLLWYFDSEDSSGDYHKKSVMGSNSRGKDGEGTSGVNRVEEDSYEYEQEEMRMRFLPAELQLLHSNVNTNGFIDPLVQLPPHGPTPPPPLVTQQVRLR